MTEVDIYTDGSAHGNPGPGGYGAVLLYQKPDGEIIKKEISDGFVLTTNNRMELLAPIMALKCLNRPCRVRLFSDSKYLVDAINKGWVKNWQSKGWKRDKNKPVKNLDLWLELTEAMKPHSLEFIWVKGHADNKYNERCDTLANEAAGKDDLKADEGYEIANN